MTDASPPTDAELPATDASALERLKRFGGDVLLGKMIDLFLIAAPERIAAVRQADAEGDIVGAERALHSLKSSSAQLGAMRMQRLSAQGEQQAHQGSMDGMAALSAELDEELARVRQWLTNAREGGAA
jgi:two-component system sensor histidine kinase/response regulator